MYDVIRDNLHQALLSFSDQEKIKELIEAKKQYFSLTGVVHEDSEEYEMRMHCFNDWFLFQYRPDGVDSGLMKKYIDNTQMEDGLREAFSSVRYSLFEFAKINFRGHVVLYDVLKKEKHVLPKGHPHIGLVENDIFIGRILTYKKNPYLLEGICVLPVKFKNHFFKQAKKVKKLADFEKETEFLIKLEALKTKWVRFGRVDVEKIFVF